MSFVAVEERFLMADTKSLVRATKEGSSRKSPFARLEIAFTTAFSYGTS